MITRIAFSTSKDSWISKIIRWFSNSTVSHCFFVYYDEDWKREMVLEATEGGFRIVPYSFYENEVVKIFIPKYSIEEGLKQSIDWLTEGYNYWGLFGMSWVELGKWLKKKWKNPLRSSNTMFCSELIARVMMVSSYPGIEDWDIQSIDPEMLMDFFEEEKGI